MNIKDSNSDSLIFNSDSYIYWMFALLRTNTGFKNHWVAYNLSMCCLARHISTPGQHAVPKIRTQIQTTSPICGYLNFGQHKLSGRILTESMRLKCNHFLGEFMSNYYYCQNITQDWWKTANAMCCSCQMHTKI